MNKTDITNINLDKMLNKISFEDSYKQHCSLQKSNTTMENKIWFGVERDINGKAINARMHLTQEQARELLPFIQKFAELGELL